ncbi:zinc-binding dehydrogenase [Acrocarpospora sp. B8E8]|uniref:zinc-binding dehydrogenase n=1 Tax=Acrocarpospora sp. B8E8 TaxID=3153572 RepID=UPI00325C79AA
MHLGLRALPLLPTGMYGQCQEARLQAAKNFGADVAIGAGTDAVAAVAELTGGLGADVAIEAVGVPETFELCTRLVRPGGHVANIGVHGKPATLHLEDLWIRNVTIITGLVDTYPTPTLLSMIVAGRLDTGQFSSPTGSPSPRWRRPTMSSPARRTPEP